VRLQKYVKKNEKSINLPQALQPGIAIFRSSAKIFTESLSYMSRDLGYLVRFQFGLFPCISHACTSERIWEILAFVHARL
jgi:hypothetical protein